MTRNPFSDPNHFLRDGVRAKDVVVKVRGAAASPSLVPSPEDQDIFSLEERADCYRIRGVPFESQGLEVLKSLLARKATKSWWHWRDYSVAAREWRDFEVPSAFLLHSILSTLYAQRRNATYKQAMSHMARLFHTTFRDTRVWTLSNVSYPPQGLDKIVHGAGLPGGLIVQERFWGRDEWLDEASASRIYDALCGEPPDRIAAAYKWLTGKRAFLWRANAPAAPANAGVTYGGQTDRFNISCATPYAVELPAFGVRRIEKDAP
jgi:hypothetical protein